MGPDSDRFASSIGLIPVLFRPVTACIQSMDTCTYLSGYPLYSLVLNPTFLSPVVLLVFFIWVIPVRSVIGAGFWLDGAVAVGVKPWSSLLWWLLVEPGLGACVMFSVIGVVSKMATISWTELCMTILTWKDRTLTYFCNCTEISKPQSSCSCVYF